MSLKNFSYDTFSDLSLFFFFLVGILECFQGNVECLLWHPNSSNRFLIYSRTCSLSGFISQNQTRDFKDALVLVSLAKTYQNGIKRNQGSINSLVMPLKDYNGFLMKKGICIKRLC